MREAATEGERDGWEGKWQCLFLCALDVAPGVCPAGPASLTREFFRTVSAVMCLPSWTRKAFVLLERKVACLALSPWSPVCLSVC